MKIIKVIVNNGNYKEINFPDGKIVFMEIKFKDLIWINPLIYKK
jgi:hypothetical protein